MPADVCRSTFGFVGLLLNRQCLRMRPLTAFKNAPNPKSVDFLQRSNPHDRDPQNNRWGKFWTNLGFGAFLNAVRGERVRKPGVPAILNLGH